MNYHDASNFRLFAEAFIYGTTYIHTYSTDKVSVLHVYVRGSLRLAPTKSCIVQIYSIATKFIYFCKVGRGNSGHFNFRSTVTKNGQTLAIGKLLAMYIQGLNLPTTH